MKARPKSRLPDPPFKPGEAYEYFDDEEMRTPKRVRLVDPRTHEVSIAYERRLFDFVPD